MESTHANRRVRLTLTTSWGLHPTRPAYGWSANRRRPLCFRNTERNRPPPPPSPVGRQAPVTANRSRTRAKAISSSGCAPRALSGCAGGRFPLRSGKPIPLGSHPQTTAGRSLRSRTAPARPSRSLATLGQPSPAATSILGRQAAQGRPWPLLPRIPARRWSLRFSARGTATRSAFWGAKERLPANTVPSRAIRPRWGSIFCG